MSSLRSDETYNLRLPILSIDFPQTFDDEESRVYKETMSVKEMAEMLGLCKSESYYLVKKNYFKVIPYYKGLRVDIKSFEAWYKTQFRYKKVNGEEPGEKYKDKTFSAKQVMAMLNCSAAHVFELIATNQFKSYNISGYARIDIASFQEWLSKQDKYPLKKRRKR